MGERIEQVGFLDSTHNVESHEVGQDIYDELGNDWAIVRSDVSKELYEQALNLAKMKGYDQIIVCDKLNFNLLCKKTENPENLERAAEAGNYTMSFDRTKMSDDAIKKAIRWVKGYELQKPFEDLPPIEKQRFVVLDKI
jgi:hypothetical protein